MKIDVNSLAANQLSVDRGPKQVSSGSPAGIQSSTEDRTTLRTGNPEIRQDKVDDLQQSVSSGQYQVSAKAIASAIIDSGE